MRLNVMQVSACVTVLAAAIAGPVVMWKSWPQEAAAVPAPRPIQADTRFEPVSREPLETQDRYQSNQAGPTQPVPERFTKIEFDNYVYGKTKAQIRAAFGAPSMVHDNDDSWYYPDLPIYDPQAGIRTDVNVRFAGMEGPDDFVVEVRY